MFGMWIWWGFLIAVIVGVAWFANANYASSKQTSESAENILKRRFASGEIDLAEYEQGLSELRK